MGPSSLQKIFDLKLKIFDLRKQYMCNHVVESIIQKFKK